MAPLNDLPAILAQTPAPAPANPLGQFLFLGLMFAAMYFLLIAPQRKKQKELQKMIDGLTTGDEVMTAGGIYGEITNKKDDRFVIRIAENTKVEIGKAFIQAVVKKTEKK